MRQLSSFGPEDHTGAGGLCLRGLQVTGVISAMACGGKQAAVSHTLYSYFCCVHPELAAGFLHGELVGSTLVYQLAVNGAQRKRRRR